MLGYVIATNESYIDKAVPPLLDSMIESGVPKNRIFIYSGGYRLPFLNVFISNIVCHQLTYRAYEYTPLCAIADGYEFPFDHLFLLHDTCKVGINFYELSNQFYPSMDAVSISDGICNIGVYKTEYIRSKKQYMDSFKDCTKMYAMEQERVLWEQAPKHCNYHNHGFELLETEAVYSDELRQVEYYRCCNLYKMKKNWGQLGSNPSVTL